MTQQDIRLKDMQISEKVDLLKELIARAEVDTDYAQTVAWGDSGIAKVTAEINVLVDNAITLFEPGKIDSLDKDIQADTYAKFQTKLDAYLRLFPEYQHEDKITESVTQHI